MFESQFMVYQTLFLAYNSEVQCSIVHLQDWKFDFLFEDGIVAEECLLGRDNCFFILFDLF